jgi:hypothetical protein
MPQQLLSELQKMARAIGGELSWFADRMEGLHIAPSVRPSSVPVLNSMPNRLGETDAVTQPVVSALIQDMHSLNWTQSYDREDGFSKGYLDNYGFVNIVSPKGHYLSRTIRVSVGFWGEGLRYPDHAHAPEEWYVMLAGGCDLTSEGIGTRPLSAGQIAHHVPWQRHSAEMKNTPLLAAAFWRGEGLMDKSIIYEDP